MKRQLSSLAMTPPAQRLFSGIQPTGVPHIGNYLGAIQNWKVLQDKHNGMMCSIVDLHAITMPQQPSVLKENIINMAASLVACGIDVNRSTLFVQSEVPQHTELMWILGSVSPLAWLNRMTQYKDKSKADKSGKTNCLGLYSYPVLQAADILLYKATDVPVGADQQQHLELSRTIATTFNHTYNTKVMVPPNAMFVQDNARVMSLRDGSKKMSKSDISTLSRIDLTDTADEINKKIRRAKSDTLGVIRNTPEERPSAEHRPEIHNLLGLLAATSGQSREALLQHFDGQGMELVKAATADAIIHHICPIGDEIRRLQGDKAFLLQSLQIGTDKAQSIAAETLKEVRSCVGLGL